MVDTRVVHLGVPFVDLRSQSAFLSTEIDEAISRVQHQADFILGQDVSLFEEEFAAYCESAYAVGVDSGTSALELALRAYNIGPGDEVITAANTFIATALAVSYTGAAPVLVDADPETYTIDPVLVERAISNRTKAVIPVHLFGQPADMDLITGIARRHGLVVIEDACQAHGAKYREHRAGSMGDAAAFSFYPSKNLGAYGDGGMVVTHDAAVADRLRLLRNYGQKEKNRHILFGYNRRLDTLQAAVLRVKLSRLDEGNALRRRHAADYDRLLAHSGVTTPRVADYAAHVYHLYVVQASGDRDSLRRHLSEQRIATGIHYPIPIHLQPSYEHLGYKKGDFPITERLADRMISLPMFPEVTPDQIEAVSQAICSYYG